MNELEKFTETFNRNVYQIQDDDVPVLLNYVDIILKAAPFIMILEIEYDTFRTVFFNLVCDGYYNGDIDDLVYISSLRLHDDGNSHRTHGVAIPNGIIVKLIFQHLNNIEHIPSDKLRVLFKNISETCRTSFIGPDYCSVEDKVMLKNVLESYISKYSHYREFLEYNSRYVAKFKLTNNHVDPKFSGYDYLRLL